MSEPAHEHGDVVVIGVGNRWRRDDGVGISVAEQLHEQAIPGVRIRTCEGDLIDLLDAWSGASRAIVIDAMRAGGPPGTVRHVDVSGDFENSGWSSTHSIGVAEAVAIARALGSLPPALELIGIEANDVTLGEGLTPEVAQSAGTVVESLVGRLRAVTERHESSVLPAPAARLR